MNTPQHRRLFQGFVQNYAQFIAQFLQSALWYRHQEPSGSVMLNSGTLSPTFLFPLPQAPTNPPVTPPQATPQLGTDMDMEAVGVTAWTAGNSATLTKEGSPHSGTKCLRVMRNGVNNPQATQTILVSGRVYHLTGWVRSDGSATPAVYSGVLLWSGTTSTNWQAIDIVFVAANTGLALQVSSAGTQYAEYDDLTLTEYLPVYNLLRDGDMEAVNVGAWTAGGSATLTKETGTPHSGSRCLRVARNGVNNPYAYQTNVVIGRAYRLVGYARSDGNATPRVLGVATFWQGTTGAGWQAFDVIFVADATTVSFRAITGTGTEYVEFDDLVLTEYYPPVFNVLTDGNMEAVNTGAWTVGNSATLTKETGTPHEGTRCLRIARNGVNNPFALQSVLVPGRVYRLTGWARGDGTAQPRVYATSIYWTGTTSTDWQAIDITFSSLAAALNFQALANGANYVEFDDLQLTPVMPTQLLVDGDMELADVNAWVAGNSATLTKDTGSPHGGSRNLRVSRNGVNSPYAQQTPFTVGRAYHIVGFARGDGSANPFILNGATNIWTGTNSASWQAFDFIAVAVATSFNLYAGASAGTQYTEWDDITITEWSGSVINDGDCEKAGVTDWTAGANTTLSKQTGTPHGGSRVLRVERNGVSTPRASQSPMVVGSAYRAVGYARSDGTAVPRVRHGSTVLWDGTTSTSWQAFDAVFTASSATFEIGATAATVDGQYVEYDDLVLTPWYGELLTDGNMEAATTAAWTALNNATLTKEGSAHSGSRCLRVARSITNFPAAVQYILTATHRYRVIGYARGDGTAAPSLYMGATNIWNGTSSTTWQFFDVVGIAADNTLIFQSATSSGTTYTEWDDVSVTEDMTGIGTYTAVTVAQPGKLSNVDSVALDGATSLATVPANILGKLPQFTLAFLCKAVNAGEGNSGSIFQNNAGVSLVRIGGATGTMLAQHAGATTNMGTTTTDVIPFNQWIWIFVTFDDYGDRVGHIYLGYRGVVSELIATTKTPMAGAFTDLSAGALTLYNAVAADHTFNGNGDEWHFVPRVVRLDEMQRVVTLTGV